MRLAVFSTVVLYAAFILACTLSSQEYIKKSGVAFNQTSVESVYAGIDVDPENIISVFTYIFNSLPKSIIVYPTENYYYFNFFSKGVPYRGNLRLDVSNPKQAKLHFAYFIAKSPWLENNFTRYKLLDDNDGVSISIQGRQSFLVSYNGRSVVFDMSPMKSVKLTKGLKLSNESLIGAMMDDSAIPFFYIYQKENRLFLYVLNHDYYPAQWLKKISGFRSLYMDRRSGFVFYKDNNGPRYILVAVYGGNVDENNYFDGPFDQLPDYAIKDDSYKIFLEETYPSLKGLIDRFGNFDNDRGRVLINPYLVYYQLVDLNVFSQCDTLQQDSKPFYNCLSPNR